MGLTEWISALAAGRVHVLVVEVPGALTLRVRAEAAVVRRGWLLADTPADADVLLVCGEPDPRFSQRIEAVWAQLPGPRHRATVTDGTGVDATLDTFPFALTDLSNQVSDARTRPQQIGMVDSDEGDEPHDGSEHGGGTSMHDMHDMHDSMDMPDSHMHMSMDMSGPAGIPLAGGDDGDRDGLEMDVTHLTLGPILPHWPSSLVVNTTLSGDVVVSAELEWLASRAEPAEDPLILAAGYLDDALRVISVAGWEPAALLVRRIRDDLLNGGNVDAAARRLSPVTKRIGRSRTLAWSLAGIPSIGSLDCRNRLLGCMRAAADLLSGGGTAPNDEWTLDELHDAIVGQELSTVRLIVANAGERGIRTSTEVSHG